MTNPTPLNSDALEAAKRVFAMTNPRRLCAYEDLPEKRQQQIHSQISQTVAAYLAAAQPDALFTVENLQKFRAIVESGTPLARNTVLRLIDNARASTPAAQPAVNSAEELDALPVGSVIADLYDDRGDAPVVLCKTLNRDWAALTTGTQNGRQWWTSAEIAHVARRLRVLHRPEVGA